MDKNIKVLGIVGSLRKDSYNKWLMKNALELAPQNIEIEVFYLHDIPLFNQDLEDPKSMPDSVKEFKKKLRGSDVVLIATPEYNYSIPGVLKNAIDWGSRPYGDNSWNGKVIALLGASIGGFGTLRAQLHLRNSFLGIAKYVISQPEIYVSFAAEKFDENGNLKDEETKKKIKQLWNVLAGMDK